MMPPDYQRHKIIVVFVLGILFFFPAKSYAQLQKANELIKLSDLVYGADDRLDFGNIYHPQNMNTISHPFLISDDWKKGTIFMNGMKYRNANLKYNIEKDEIFYKGENPSVIILTKSYIDSLIMNNRLLINSDKLGIQNNMGFVELLYTGRYTSFLKHQIGVTQVSTSNSISLMYMTPKFIVYLKHDDQLININSKKSLFYYFAPNKKDISRFMKKNKIKYKKATQHQLISLLKYCDNFPTNPEIE
jgi:hypothetical protein